MLKHKNVFRVPLTTIHSFQEMLSDSFEEFGYIWTFRIRKRKEKITFERVLLHRFVDMISCQPFLLV